MKGNGKSRNHGQNAGGGKLGQAALQAKLMQGGNHTSHGPKPAAACSAHSHMLALPEPTCPLCSPFHGLRPPCKLHEGNRHPDGRSEARQAMPGLALPHTFSCCLIQQPLETSNRALLVGDEGNRAFCEGLGSAATGDWWKEPREPGGSKSMLGDQRQSRCKEGSEVAAPHPRAARTDQCRQMDRQGDRGPRRQDRG